MQLVFDIAIIVFAFIAGICVYDEIGAFGIRQAAVTKAIEEIDAQLSSVGAELMALHKRIDEDMQVSGLVRINHFHANPPCDFELFTRRNPAGSITSSHLAEECEAC